MAQSIPISRISINLTNPPGSVLSVDEANHIVWKFLKQETGYISESLNKNYFGVLMNIVGNKNMTKMNSQFSRTAREIQDLVVTVEEVHEKTWKITFDASVEIAVGKNKKVTRVQELKFIQTNEPHWRDGLKPSVKQLLLKYKTVEDD